MTAPQSEHDDFFSPQRQFRRDFMRTWRRHTIAFWTGPLYVLAGFYAFQNPGSSQVYDVLAPFVIASIILLFLSIQVHYVESTPGIWPLMYNLPRDRSVWWRAQTAYLLAVIVWLDAWALAGTCLKLGGAGITPHYRLYPEAVALPFFATAIVGLCYGNFLPRDVLFFLFALFVGARGLYLLEEMYIFTLSGTIQRSEPLRDIPLPYCFIFAIIMLTVSALMWRSARKAWDRFQRGEKS